MYMYLLTEYTKSTKLWIQLVNHGSSVYCNCNFNYNTPLPKRILSPQQTFITNKAHASQQYTLSFARILAPSRLDSPPGPMAACASAGKIPGA